MFRRSKMYLACAAVFAVMAVVPATSSADYFERSNINGYETVDQTDPVFEFDKFSKNLKCATAVGAVSVALTASYFDVTVTYTGCTLSGVVLQDENISSPTFRYWATGKVDILTPLTVYANIILGDCTLTVPAQNGLSTASYINDEHWMDVMNDLGGISYSVSKTKGVICNNGSASDGTLTGTNRLSHSYGGNFIWHDSPE